MTSADCPPGRIFCGGEIHVRSGRGNIMGGRVWAAKKISASAIGARSEVKTSVSLGGLPCATLEQELVRQKLARLGEELERLALQIRDAASALLKE